MSGILNSAGTLLDEYRQCSFRGVPFATIGSGGKAGRKTAVHEYPFRDSPWVEDLGRANRVFRVRGFITGPAFLAQFDLLYNAVEQQGPGLLIHPTRGVIQASVVDFDWREPDGYSGVIEVDLAFIEAKASLSTTVLAAVSGAITVATGLLSLAFQSDYASDIAPPLALGQPVNNAASALASSWAASAVTQSLSPQAIASALSVLPTFYGRFVTGNAPVGDASATVESALDGVTVGQAAVALAAGAVATSINGGASGLAAAIAAVPEALRSMVGDPRLAISLLAGLLTTPPVNGASSAAIGSAIIAAQTATASICRRATLLSIALACGDYQPTSSNDAETLRAQVAGYFDTEIWAAGQVGDDASFIALRNTRATVLQLIAQNASQLPSMVTVTRNAPVPACVIAQQLYADGSRTPQVITGAADVVHPAFMPLSFQALSS